MARLLAVLLVLSSLACAAPPQKLEVPPGFSVSVYADVPGARSMALAPDGTLFVGTRASKVFRVSDRDKNRVADKVEVLAEGLNRPNGVAFHKGSLYVAEISRILRYDKTTPGSQPTVVTDSLPTDRHHGWKFIRFGPDGKLYVPVGAPCNVCESENPIYASILRMNPDGSQREIFAHGVRNTVGFDWQPDTGVLWFTDNGRDWLGDDRPPCELNRAPKLSLHFGFPYRWGHNQKDPEFGDRGEQYDFTPPVRGFQAHTAPLGMRFYQGKMFPKRYQNQILVAQHGSWNRSSKVGYRVMLVEVQGDKVIQATPFMTGFLRRGSVSGRPVDIEVLDDGSVLVSDDHAGKIYRISHD